MLTWLNTEQGRRSLLQYAELGVDGRWQGPLSIAVGKSFVANAVDTPHIAIADDRALWVQFLQQQLHFRFFRQRRVIRFGLRARKQLGQHSLMHVGALAHVERCKMKAEDFRSTLECRQPRLDQHRAVMRIERVGDGLQIAREFGNRRIG